MLRKQSSWIALAIASVLGLIFFQLAYTAKKLEAPTLQDPDIERAMQIDRLQTVR